MKVLTIVGIRKSGKTSTVEALLRAISWRGQRGGTCKSIFCPSFTIDPNNSNTARHMRAGAQLVCARAKHETSFISPEALPLSQVLSAFAGFDYVLLEGDYLAPVPRLVAAHGEKDARERTNALTLAYVGRVSTQEVDLPLPRFNALEDADALLDFIDEQVADIVPGEALDAPLPQVSGVTDDGFCQCGCHHHENKLQVTINGKEIVLTKEQQAQLRTWAEEQNA